MEEIALTPLGGTNLNWASSTAGAHVPVAQARDDAQQGGGSRFGDDIPGRQWLFACGNEDLEIDTRAAEEQMIVPDPAHDRLADHHRQGHILHQQRKGIAIELDRRRGASFRAVSRAKVIIFSIVSGASLVA